MTNFNKPAMGLVLIGALVLGGCSGGGTQYTSTDTKRTDTVQQPGTTATTNPSQDANNNGINDADETANNGTTTNNGTTANNTTTNNTTTTTAENNGKHPTGDLSLVSFDKTAKPGQEVTLTAKAEPGVKVKIEADGLGFETGLGDQTANDKGEVTWKFKVDNSIKANEVPIIVTALYDDIQKKQIAEIKVDQPKDKLASFPTDLSGFKKTVEPGEQITLKVKTAPKADVKIKAEGAEGFGPGLGKKADANGIAEFSFKIDKDYKADKMPIIVTADLDGKQKKTIEALEVPKVAMKKDNGKNL